MKTIEGKKGKTKSPLKPPSGNRLVVRKWGNSAGLRIPMSMMRAAKFKVDEEVNAHVEQGKLIVEKAAGRKYKLKDLLNALTPENSHDFIDDAATGKEVW